MIRGSWSNYPVADRVGISVRVPHAVKAKLDRMARNSGRSLAAEVERLIELGLLADEMLSKWGGEGGD